ncbi:hypothetical protein V5799_031704 [Amblyomma americanum]|uniref:Carboxylesterase type B domain-containing protein n=1 Tax=Amblyomma americanum TaxID=6943 RepID=A0AAQ4DT98_AMBAM
MCVLAAVTTLVTLTVLVTVAAGVIATTMRTPASSSTGASTTYTGDASGITSALSSNGAGGRSLEDVVRARTPSCGEVAGVVEDGAFVFKALRYAEAPVGERRWRKPQQSSAQSCVEGRRAEHFGSPCLQANPVTKKFEGSEDCLFLNVWTPRIDATAGLDVLVWIHGGFLQLGSGHQPGLSPSGKLARAANAVLVSFNYRLGPLGFLALAALGPDVNHGLWDAALALTWVRDNIRALGGDPNKVTVVGTDAGASLALAVLAASPRTGWGRLFQAAWLDGPSSVLNRTYAQVAKHNKAFFQQRSGCSNATCLRALSGHDVIKAHLGKDDPSFRIRDQNDLPIQGIFPEQFLVVDGTVLTKPPLEMIEGESKCDIPILIGSSSQAVDIWPGPDDLSHWSWSQYKKYVTTSLDSFGSGITQMALQLYNVTNATESGTTPELVYTTMVTDLRVGCPLANMASDLATAFQSPVYRYISEVRPSKPDHFLGGDGEIDAERDLTLRDAIREMALRFVRSGGRSVPVADWMRYPKTIAILRASNATWDVVPTASYKKTECKFWTSEGLTQYAWIS